MSTEAGVATYSVGEVASLAGVSVRALHHYDETGLLVASHRSHAGYRRYTRGDLDRLQELLVYRRLGFSLAEIAALLDDPGHDRRSALLRQRDLLAQRMDELAAVRRLVERTLMTMEGAITMSDEQRFAGLGTYERNDAEFGEEVRERWGGTDAYAESTRRASSYTEDDWAAIKAETEAIEAGFADLLAAGVPADDVAAMEVAERHRRQIDARFYPCSHEMHANLAEMYTADARFTEHYEQRRAGLAAYVRDAILANAVRAV
ncbi:MAG: MerR family transcriptional regulator [Jiangellales bacterium]